MATDIRKTPAPTPSEKRAALEEVLQSETFSRAGQLQSFLRFVCEKEMTGHAADLGEYMIGVEALGRPTGYSPGEDSVVRRRAIDLRDKLEKVYSTELSGSRLRIVLPKGRYVPRFEWVDSTQGSDHAASAVDVELGVCPARPAFGRRLAHFWPTVAAFALGGLLTAGAFRLFSPRRTEVVTPGVTYEAEARGNTLAGTTARSECIMCSGGYNVRWIGGGHQSYVALNGIVVPTSGQYALFIYYSVAEPRSFFVSVDDGPGVEVPVTGASWAMTSSVSINVSLKAGPNKVKFYNEKGFAPDLDRIVLLQ